MTDRRKWISVAEASVVWRIKETDILGRLKEGRDWVQMRRTALVSVGQMCRLYGREPWKEWGSEEVIDGQMECEVTEYEQLRFDVGN